MGSFFENFHVFGKSKQEVADAFTSLLAGEAYLVVSGKSWVSVYPDGCESCENLAQKFSISLETTVFCTRVHDSDVAWYTLYEGGVVLDEFCSNPAYFADANTVPLNDALGSQMAGLPEVLVRFAKGEVTTQAIAAILHKQELFAEDTLRRIAELFGIDPDCVLASMRYLEGDNPTIGARTAKRIEALPPPSTQGSTNNPGDAQYVNLYADPTNAEIWAREGTADFLAKRLGWSEAEIKPIAEQLADFAPAVRIVAEVASEAGWPPKKVLSFLSRTKWRQDGVLERAGEMAIEAVARRLAETRSKNLVSHSLAYLSIFAYYPSPFPIVIIPDASHWKTALTAFYRYGVLAMAGDAVLFDPFLQQAMRVRVIPGRAPSDRLTGAIQIVDLAARDNFRDVLASVESALGHLAGGEGEIVVWLTRPGDAVQKSLERGADLAHRVSRHYESETDLARAIHYGRLRIKFLELLYGPNNEKVATALNELVNLAKS